jgi:hypothetical protein
MILLQLLCRKFFSGMHRVGDIEFATENCMNCYAFTPPVSNCCYLFEAVV